MIAVLQCLLAVAILIMTHFIYKHLMRRWRKEPSGPWGLPIVGYALNLKPRSFKALMRIKASHPDVAQVDFGEQSMILLNSYEAVKEALLTKGDNFAGRRNMPLFEAFELSLGLVNSEGSVWKEHRRFALRTLRDFGFGRNGSELIIQAEIQNLIQMLNEQTEKGNRDLNISDYLIRSVSNVICTLTLGEQPCYETEETLELLNKFREKLDFNPFTLPPLMYPTLFKWLTPLLSSLPQTRDIMKMLRDIVDYLQVKIDAHEKDFNAAQESKDYIEEYLKEKHKMDSTNPRNHSFTSKQLQGEVFDFFLAGTDTTSNSLSWGFLLLAIHSQIQRKCHEEIDSTIGRDRQPFMKDKEQMPYIQAVLDEVQRYATIVPGGVTHRNYQADTIQGYHIPADSFIVPFLYGVHHDPRVWERPEEFYPDHFLCNVDRKLKYKPREELIPFSIGKRECLGESLAKMELFLFFVNILQKYEFHLPKTRKYDLDEVLLGTDGPIHSPGRHELLVQPRH